MTAGGERAGDEGRAACLANWPEAENGAYHPRCCRFPKSCSVPARQADGETWEDTFAAMAAHGRAANPAADRVAALTAINDGLREDAPTVLLRDSLARWLYVYRYGIVPAGAQNAIENWDGDFCQTKDNYRADAEALLAWLRAALDGGA